MKNNSLFGLFPEEIANIIQKYDARSFNARQIAEWMYAKRVFDFDEMSNLPKQLREHLKAEFPLIVYPYKKVETSKDGTKKYLFEFEQGRVVETAVIPEDDRITVCVSSQAGCRFGCRFCATGTIGFGGNLSAGEILNQLVAIDESKDITNIVYMGMGEPLDNWEEVHKSIEILTSEKMMNFGAGRITVSTIGINEYFGELINKTRVNIAVSLHSPFPEERAHIMPAQKSNPLSNILEIIEEANISRYRKLSFEYILIKGLNMSKSHAQKLADMAIRYNAHVNLIAYNPVVGLPFDSPAEKDILGFQNELILRGVNATLRKPRGRDISAACGTLAGNKAGK